MGYDRPTNREREGLPTLWTGVEQHNDSAKYLGERPDHMVEISSFKLTQIHGCVLSICPVKLFFNTNWACRLQMSTCYEGMILTDWSHKSINSFTFN